MKCMSQYLRIMSLKMRWPWIWATFGIQRLFKWPHNAWMISPHPGHMWAVDLGNSFTTHLSCEAQCTSWFVLFIVSICDVVVGNEHPDRASITFTDHEWVFDAIIVFAVSEY